MRVHRCRKRFAAGCVAQGCSGRRTCGSASCSVAAPSSQLGGKLRPRLRSLPQTPQRRASFVLLPLLLCSSACGTTRNAGSLCARVSLMKPYEPSDVCHDGVLSTTVGTPFRLPARRQITAFDYSSVREIFCYKIGQCDAKQPVFIASRRGERLPTIASGSVNLTLCATTTVTNGAATMCCDLKTAGVVEVTLCERYGAPADYFYAYRIWKWPATMPCGTLCTTGSGPGSSSISLWPAIDNGQVVPEVYLSLPEDVQSNVVYTELIPTTTAKTDPRKMWSEYRQAIEERLRRDLICIGRPACHLDTQLLPPVAADGKNVTDRVALHYYIWNEDANETVDAWTVRAHALLMPDVALYFSKIGDVQVTCEIDFEASYVDDGHKSTVEVNSSAAFAASLAVVGFITTVLGMFLYCHRLRNGNSKLPKEVALNNIESNGGFDNLAMNELHGRIRPLSDVLESP